MLSSCIALLACLLFPLEDTPGTVVRDQVGRKLDQAVRSAGPGEFWGAVLVARGGQVLLAKGYGAADYERVPITPATLFEMASTSKQFTAAAILRLEMEGKLKLTDTLPRFFKKVPEDKRAITVHHLLTHTSGMDPNTGLSYAARETRDQFVEFILRPPLVSGLGEKWAYFNSGYALLAAIVEVASGQSFEDYSRERLFRPAGMADTGFIQDKALEGKPVTARRGQGMPGTAVDWHWSWGYRGMGGVVTTVGDLLKWDRALHGDKVLDKAAKEKLYRPEKSGYACGWMVETTPRGTTKVHHGGGVAGYRCQYARFLEEDVVIAVLSNEAGNVHGIAQALEDILFPPPRVEAVIRFGAYERNQFQAVPKIPGASWKVRVDGGALHLDLADPAKGGAAAATVSMPRGAALGLATEVEKALGGKPDDGKTGQDAGIFLGRYKLAGKELKLSEGLRLTVMPRYVGQGAEGQVVDERPLLLLVDTKVGQWPLMAHLEVATARKLAADLRAAAGK